MATQALKDQFFSALLNSKSYQLMDPNEQKDLMEKYKEASDEQLNAALLEIKSSSAEVEKIETNASTQMKEQAKLAAEIKTDFESLKKVEVHEMMEKDQKESSEAADKMIVDVKEPAKEGFFAKLLKTLKDFFYPPKK